MSVEVEVGASLSCKWKVKQYIELFDVINREYTSYCIRWNENFTKSYNLGKVCICDVYSLKSGIDKEFKKYMDSFIDGLLRLSMNIFYEFNRLNPDFKIRTRIKDPQSILGKIERKSKMNSGKFPINKILNDLLGIRIVDRNYKDNIEYIKEYFEVAEYKVKHMLRIKDEYIGYHVYFKQDKNIYFPIELQIWDSEYEINNYESHKVYKEDYIFWSEKYKKT
ncbi:hypothetical protein NSA50_18205 [Clostridium sp. DSM 100503]|uniref:hypothetical protein n=1 Tax=Clostridium sp. DSM 100503 TaxID=2963282 RepID=UPI002149F763|nr:hypothetical protein [Clostridium sp. DSM 100503]MCR1952939.1 hypothetical protein [Clostridium sp. DSM 100503]